MIPKAEANTSSPAQLVLMFEPSYEFEFSSVAIDKMRAHPLYKEGAAWWVYEVRDFWRSDFIQGRVFKFAIVGEGCSLKTPPPMLYDGSSLVGLLCNDLTEVEFTKNKIAQKAPIKLRQDQEVSLPSGEVVVIDKAAELQVLAKKNKKWSPLWSGSHVQEALGQYSAAPRPRRLMVVGVKEPLEEET